MSAEIAKLLKFYEKGDRVAARLTMPDGRTITATAAVVRPGQSFDSVLSDRRTISGMGAGKFRRKLRKGLKKVGKIAAPVLQIAAPVLSVASLAMPALAPAAVAAGVAGKLLSRATSTAKHVRKAVNQAMPSKMAAINASSASPALKLVAGKRVRAALTAVAIAETTAGLQPNAKKIMQRAIVVATKADQRAVDAAKVTALATAVAKARAKSAAPKPTGNEYIVTRPDGRVVRVPASRV